MTSPFTDNPGDDGWTEWGKHVLAELKRLGSESEGMQKQMVELSNDIAALRVKAGMWGAIAGAIPVIILLVYDRVAGP